MVELIALAQSPAIPSLRAWKESNPLPWFWRPRCSPSSDPDRRERRSADLSIGPRFALDFPSVAVMSAVPPHTTSPGSAAYGSRTRLTGVTSQPRHRSRHAASFVSRAGIEPASHGLGNHAPRPEVGRWGDQRESNPRAASHSRVPNHSAMATIVVRSERSEPAEGGGERSA